MTCAPLAQSSAPHTYSKAVFADPAIACALLPSLLALTTACVVGQVRTNIRLGMCSSCKVSLLLPSLERWTLLSAVTPFYRSTLGEIRRHTTSTCADDTL